VDLQQLLEVLLHLVTLPPLFPQQAVDRAQTMAVAEVTALREVAVVAQTRTFPWPEEPEIHHRLLPHKVTTAAMVVTTKVAEAVEHLSPGKTVAHCHSVRVVLAVMELLFHQAWAEVLMLVAAAGLGL
jgi:hypothetical protein